MNKKNTAKEKPSAPSFIISTIPIITLLTALIVVILTKGASEVMSISYLLLLGASAICIGLSILLTNNPLRNIRSGIYKSSRQILPTIPILIFIGTLSSTWMLSGVVPTLIYYGIKILNPLLFLVLACCICAIISVVTGTSWTTIATIGVAFIGIGKVMGYSEAWIAGAIISGAYFGDKVSPLSDTTVLASSSTGVDIFSHIRFMMMTTIPAMLIALVIFGCLGFMSPTIEDNSYNSMLSALDHGFNISGWTLIIPAIAAIMIALRLPTYLILATGSLTGLLGIFLFQPQIINELCPTHNFIDHLLFSLQVIGTNTEYKTGYELLDSLVSTDGIQGMLPTIFLVLSAMIFGGVMIGSGMLKTITGRIISKLHHPSSIVNTTVSSGIFLNCCTGDQYLSLIIGGNLFKNIYNEKNIRPHVLSRALEDSISVTSVLIPWNSCGVAQATVLGVATLTYLPCCIFNILSPFMSILLAKIGWKIMLKREVAIIPPTL